MENSAYGFVYMTTNLVNGKMYIGQKKIDNESRWKSYLGSGVHLKKAISKYGKDNFRRDILHYAYSQKELDELEYTLIKDFNAVESDNFYNAVDGGFTATELTKINSIPIINIDTGYVFKSIKDASIWSKNTVNYIKSTFDQKHDINNKSSNLIFKHLNKVVLGYKLCGICASNYRNGVHFLFCDKCISHKKFNTKMYNLKIPNSLCYEINDLWVIEYIKNNSKGVVYGKYSKMPRTKFEEEYLECDILKSKSLIKNYTVKEIEDIIIKKYNKGTSISEISYETGINDVENILKNNNIKIRPKIYDNYKSSRYSEFFTKLSFKGEIKVFRYLFELRYYLNIRLIEELSYSDINKLLVGKIEIDDLLVEEISDIEFMKLSNLYQTLENY